MLLIKLVALTFLYGVFGRTITENDPKHLTISTSKGKITGKKHRTIEGKKLYYAFKGIPYAEPPIGELRFEPPIPKRKWHGNIQTIEESADCIQGGEPVMGSEDCLTLNVYTPQYPSSDDALLPVMVYIYGGGFNAGTSNYTTFGPDYFLDSGVIIVTINYRIGLLGFLSTGDLASPGNNGLRDQILALKWNKNEIRRFGGDPYQVTLFGQSAGSVSVSYLLQTRQCDGLFHKAIMQSGVSLSLWGLSRHGIDLAFTVGEDLGIKTKNSSVLVKKLREVEINLLQSKAMAAARFKYVTTSPREGFMSAPVIEPDHPNAVISESSHKLLSKGQFLKVPVMMGYNSLEGTFEISGLVRLFLAKWDVNPGGLVPIDMNIDSIIKRTGVGLKIKSKYFGLLPIAFSNMNVQKYLGDDQFVRPIREKARLLAQHVPVYLYRFSYEGGLWGYANRTQSGVTHSEELGYLWVSKYSPSEQDKIVRSRMVKMWTNFAKKSKPTPILDNVLENVNWVEAKTSNPNNLHYLNINDHLEVRINPDEDIVEFWNDLYAKNGHPPYNTY